MTKIEQIRSQMVAATIKASIMEKLVNEIKSNAESPKWTPQYLMGFQQAFIIVSSVVVDEVIEKECKDA